MMVTGLRPRKGFVSLSGTYDGQQRMAEIEDDGNPPIIGDLIELSGKIERGEYRLVLKATSWQLAEVTAQAIFEYIKRSKHFKEILTRKQLKLLMKAYLNYPKRLIINLSRSEEVELKKVINCKITVINLINAWNKLSAEIKTVHYLAEKGLKPHEAHKIVRLYGEKAREVIESNPFALVHTIGFERADRIANQIGIDVLNPERVCALGNWLSFQHCQKTSSSLFLLSDIEKQSRKYKVDPQILLKVSEDNGALVRNNIWYTSSTYHHIESTIRTFLTKVQSSNMVGFYEYEIDEQIAIFDAEQKFPLHINQREAVHSAMNNAVSCICGAAGVGKTEVINAISKINQRMLGTVMYATALSSIAVDRIKQATGLKTCITISKLKYELLKKKLDIPAGSILVIDECSMLSVQDLYVLSTLGLNNIRLIFVGDVNQLPAIGYGAFFEQAIAHFPTVELTKVWRAEVKEITDAANKVLQGEKPLERDCFGYLKGDFNAISQYAFENDAQCIAPTNDTVDLLNSLIQRNYLSLTAEPLCTIMGCSLYVNDRVIFTKNLNRKGLYNGQFAIVEKEINGSIAFRLITSDSSFTTIQLNYNEMIESGLKLGYAVTGHKAQGAGFDRVIAIIESSPLCTKNWLYTAITRAKKDIRLAEMSNVEQVTKKLVSKRITQRLVPLIA